VADKVNQKVLASSIVFTWLGKTLVNVCKTFYVSVKLWQHKITLLFHYLCNLHAFVAFDSTESGLATSWLIALTVAVYVSPIIKPVTVYEQQDG